MSGNPTLSGSYIDNAQLVGRIGPRQESSIENQGLAGHEGCTVRAHPHDGFRDFHRRSKTADGMQTERELFRLRRAPETFAHGRFDHRGTHDVYPNAASRGFERCGLRQPHHAMLASAIRGCPSGANPTCDGGHVDDDSTTALLEHLLNFVLQAKPDAFEIDVDGADAQAGRWWSHRQHGLRRRLDWLR